MFQLNLSPESPFKSDLEYLNLVNAVLDVRYNYTETCEKVRNAINAPKNNMKEDSQYVCGGERSEEGKGEKEMEVNKKMIEEKKRRKKKVN